MATHSTQVETYDQQGSLVSTRTVTWETSPEQDNEASLQQRAGDVLADLRTIRDTSGSLTAAQLSNAVRVLARACIAITRLHLRRLEGTD